MKKKNSSKRIIILYHFLFEISILESNSEKFKKLYKKELFLKILNFLKKSLIICHANYGISNVLEKFIKDYMYY